TLIGRRRGACCENDHVPFRTKRFRMIFNSGYLFYKFFNIRLFFYLLFHRFDVLVANDLDTLLPNYLISKLRRLPLVYDSHEYFTGVPELNGRPFVKWVWTSIEKFVFPDLKHVITVSDSIAGLYNELYGIMPVVIRNISPSSQSVIPYRKEDLDIRDGNLLLILQGGGINIDRGAEELIDAVRMTEKVSLIIAGSGDVIPELKTRVMNYGLSDRIKFYSVRPWNELMRLTKSADAGICFEKDTSINYRFCLPNKLFDYISAGIPVICGNLPEISKIVSSGDCGIIIPEISRQEISRAIIKLRDNPELLDSYKKNSVKASIYLNWENEKSNVALLYSRILNLKAH
ncbi:MAG: glycosyltransferase family 4 protein, partial [Bacteroidia bacterium]|nr:glycosyltransferase family 4 protein [Bacteroidia bacterium]